MARPRVTNSPRCLAERGFSTSWTCGTSKSRHNDAAARHIEVLARERTSGTAGPKKVGTSYVRAGAAHPSTGLVAQRVRSVTPAWYPTISAIVHALIRGAEQVNRLLDPQVPHIGDGRAAGLYEASLERSFGGADRRAASVIEKSRRFSRVHRSNRSATGSEWDR